MPEIGPADGPTQNVLEPYNGQIRIGIIPAAASVKIGATVAYDVREKGTDAYLVSGLANEQVTVTWSSGVAVATNNRRLQVVCTTSSTDRDQRVAAGIAAGFPSGWEHVPASGCWRVYIGERPLPIDATAEATYKQNVINAGLATTAALWKTVNTTINEPRYVTTTTTGTSASSRNPPRVTVASTARVLIGGTAQYRGIAEVMRNAAGTLAGINDVPMEEYLYGVVPRELGPTQYPETEAQKAQAVAARTYAHSNLGKHWNNGYDLLATVQDQVYGGSAAEHSGQHRRGERHGGDRGHVQRRADQRAVLRHQRWAHVQRGGRVRRHGRVHAQRVGRAGGRGASVHQCAAHGPAHARVDGRVRQLAHLPPVELHVDDGADEPCGR